MEPTGNARTDSDTWDLASSVGATATLVAAARAMASKDPRGLIDDPLVVDEHSEGGAAGALAVPPSCI